MVTQGPTLRVPMRQAAAADRRPTNDPSHSQPIAPHGGTAMKALKTVAVALGITLAALIVIPLIVLAGLFVWLKVTEEQDEELLELDREGA